LETSEQLQMNLSGLAVFNPDPLPLFQPDFRVNLIALQEKVSAIVILVTSGKEVVRVLGVIKPKWFVGENTPGLFARQNQRYFRRILADLDKMGFDVGWGIFGACEAGAPHRRNRISIIAYSSRNADNCHEQEKCKVHTEKFDAVGVCRKISDTQGSERKGNRSEQEGESNRFANICNDVSHSDGSGYLYRQNEKQPTETRIDAQRDIEPSGKDVSYTYIKRHFSQKEEIQPRRNSTKLCDWWAVEPNVGRVAHGIPSRVDRLKCLGNAVVPQQFYPVFKTIADYEAEGGRQ